MFRPFSVGRFNNQWRQFSALHQEVNRLFDTLHPANGRLATTSTYPAVNVWANEEAVLITAELPGVNSASLDVTVVGDRVTLKGEREAETLPEESKYHRRERSQGKFSRTFQLPFKVNNETIEAFFEKGVLQLTLPKAETEKAKKIAVVAA